MSAPVSLPRPVRRLLLTGLLSLSGCQGGCESDAVEDPETRAPQIAGQTVRLAVPDVKWFAKNGRLVIDDWQAATEAEVALEEIDDLAPTETPDEVRIELRPLHEIATIDRATIRPLPAPLRSADSPLWSGIFERLRDDACEFGGEPRLLPISAPTWSLYVRADLLEKAGLEPPTTWKAYRELAATRDEWADGLPVCEPWGEETRASIFLAHTIPYAKHPSNYSLFFDRDTAEPLINTPGFVAGTEELIALWPELDSDNWSRSPADCRAELLAGRACMAICREGGEGKPATIERGDGVAIDVVPLPGAERVYEAFSERWTEPTGVVNRVTLVLPESRVLVVRGPSESDADAETLSDSEAAAWAFAVGLLGEPKPEFWPRALRTPCRADALTPASLWVGKGLTTGESAGYLQAVAKSLTASPVVPELLVVGHERFRSTLTEGLDALNQPEPDAAALLSAVAERWQTVVDDIGTERIVDGYRAGLGLEPLD